MADKFNLRAICETGHTSAPMIQCRNAVSHRYNTGAIRSEWGWVGEGRAGEGWAQWRGDAGRVAWRMVDRGGPGRWNARKPPNAGHHVPIGIAGVCPPPPNEPALYGPRLRDIWHKRKRPTGFPMGRALCQVVSVRTKAPQSPAAVRFRVRPFCGFSQWYLPGGIADHPMPAHTCPRFSCLWRKSGVWT